MRTADTLSIQRLPDQGAGARLHTFTFDEGRRDETAVNGGVPEWNRRRCRGRSCVIPGVDAASSHRTRPGRVWSARTRDGHVVELVDSTSDEERLERRVFSRSSLIGCPVKCTICDAGGGYLGRLEAGELFDQLDFLVQRAGAPMPRELRVELTRVGEPAFNDDVLTFLRGLPGRYGSVPVTAVVSSVGPARSEAFFEALLDVQARYRAPNRLVMQLSMYTTDETARHRVVPIKCATFDWLAEWGARFARGGGEKVVLHFPAALELPVDAEALAARFSPELFAVKLSPITPTNAAAKTEFTPLMDDSARLAEVRGALLARGFEVKVAVDRREDPSACGRYFSSGQGVSQPRRTRVVE